MSETNHITNRDGWQKLQQYTSARIALGRTGVSVPAAEMLQFKMAHAHARDAVFSVLQKDRLIEELHSLNLQVALLSTRADSRHQYLQRPDLGRQLDAASAESIAACSGVDCDVCITLADGLSAEAINRHALPVLSRLVSLLEASRLSLSPVCVVQNGRVAVSDETGFLLNAKLSLILIGERPGLSSPDSMGAYLTYGPKKGLTDEMRNCVSNIRPEGLPYDEAVQKIFYLIREALSLRLTGIKLKDNSSRTFGLPGMDETT